MVKCKFCTDPTDLTWSQDKETKKWSLVNEYTGTPHKCKRDLPMAEIDSSNSGIKPKYRPKKSKTESLWKKDYDPIMDVKSNRYCGICDTICVTVTDCEHCEKFKLNPCDSYCPKCEKHPNIIDVRKDPEALLEFHKKHSEY